MIIYMTLRKIALPFALLALTGCASLTMDRQQAITIQTNHEDKEVTGIECALKNDEGTWSLTSPASVTVHKSAEDLVVDCKNHRITGNVSVASIANAPYSSNFLFLFGIGYLIDRKTGAGFDYPQNIVVKLTPIEEAGATAKVVSSE
ncbi:MAG: hypothetical protein KJ850_11375 [Gammaproteobacteria bacterium]|nr:hypothetical protein [Gammaproteobacteria bacterium]MBU1625630.1 hypothetical protein [Gammaproteobacteria bacterium]MBU1980890.1 hypothetical protein [Gammaproteobacteria bacterium]